METFFKNLTAEEGTKERLTQDLMNLIRDAEDLVRATSSEVAARSKEELIAALGKLKVTCRRLEKDAIARSQATDKLIRAHPYEAIGIGIGVGLLIGLLTGKR